MANVKFFLDTGALIALSGLERLDLKSLRNRVEATNSELSVTHVQINESTEHVKFAEKVQNKHGKRVRNYQEKIDSALRKLKEKGINIHLEITKIMVAGIARQGYTGAGDHEIGKLYDELRKEIDACERAKGATRPLLNIARDATIAVSSLDHDFLITCDKCLYKSWHRTIGNHGMLGQRFKVPKIILTERHPKAVANAILNVLS